MLFLIFFHRFFLRVFRYPPVRQLEHVMPFKRIERHLFQHSDYAGIATG